MTAQVYTVYEVYSVEDDNTSLHSVWVYSVEDDNTSLHSVWVYSV